MIKRIFLFTIAVLSFSLAGGQNENFFRLSRENLPQKYESKKQRVEKLFSKSIFYLQKAGKAENELINYQQSGNINPMRQIALQERVYRLYLKAYSFVEDAHRIQFKMLEELLEKRNLADREEMKVELEKQFRSGAVLRRKGESVVPRMNPKSLLTEAAEMEMEVLEEMEKLLSGETIEMDSSMKHKDSALLTSKVDVVDEGFENEVDAMIVVPPDLVEEQAGATISVRPRIEETEENVSSVKPGQKNAVKVPEPDVSADKAGEIFYSIQFLATREQVSDKQVHEIYNGALPVIESRSDGWYRFSAGKFDTVSKALSKMKKTGIHGFIVAFKGNERISISEAKKFK